MDKSYLLKEYTHNFTELLSYGFTKIDDHHYRLQKNIDDLDFYFEILIGNSQFTIDVFDKYTNECYILFNIQESTGAFVCTLRERANKLIEDILKNCFACTNIKAKVIAYIQNQFAVSPIFPWTKHKNYCTFNTQEKNKWFAVLLQISAKKLNIDSENEVTILNLKGNPDKITRLIDYTTIFPAYHMHKKLWYTVLLNKDTNFEELQTLIQASYLLVECKK